MTCSASHNRLSMLNRFQGVLRYFARAVGLTIAVLYFLIDLIFLSVVRPLRRRLIALKRVRRLREWVSTLNRYAALLFLLVPWLILEPIKPIGYLLFAHKHHLAATSLIVLGEVVKLTLFEQLFDMTKPQLMSFRWFAWCYDRWHAAIAFLRSLPMWRRMFNWYRSIRGWVRHRWLKRRTVAGSSAMTIWPLV